MISSSTYNQKIVFVISQVFLCLVHFWHKTGQQILKDLRTLNHFKTVQKIIQLNHFGHDLLREYYGIRKSGPKCQNIGKISRTEIYFDKWKKVLNQFMEIILHAALLFLL